MPTLLEATAGQDGVTRIVLNDHASRNALSVEMMSELHSALDEAAEDTATRVIIIAAEGPIFSSGHNLKQLTARRNDADRGRSYFASVFTQCAKLMRSIVANPKPVIAEVQGLASAAGCQLVASCDLAVASHNAAFCTPGVDIGLFCSTPMVALSRNVARKKVMEMLLTGDKISAEEATQLGLVNCVVEHEKLTETTRQLARRIASKSAAIVKTGKLAFYHQLELGLAEAYDYASRVMVENMLYRDATEGIDAFIDKRPPVWQDS